jgi:hypothetical protein
MDDYCGPDAAPSAKEVLTVAEISHPLDGEVWVVDDHT